ncbi:NPCBM/NEW2 domain-containing protein [Alloprevotella sp. oral taxon 473]|uniref:NPCBM/NEW2 domain-containing protein n=1 Tax=Alloprevotella sp. oral taxon 473 TaxID=712469 RepID=UPI0002A359B2|nr:NPCBM/NEW2 domain-containing protein [Alloprevotella sp. oral taxon 473]EKX92238.1 alpha-galactosidase [Alloprevotella sp. oral taxon 473 str. F0040]
MKYSTLLVGLSLACCTPALQTLAHAAPMMQVATDNVVKLPVSTDPSLEFIPLSSLDLSKMENGWKSPQRNKSIEGNPIRLGNTTYESGVGVHAPSRIVVKLNGAVTTFRAVGGIDAEVEHPNNPRDKAAILDYRVLLRGQDGQDQVIKSGSMDRDSAPIQLDIDVRNAKYLILEVNNGGGQGNWGDHFDWANAYFIYREQNSTRPEMVSPDVLKSPLACAMDIFALPGNRVLHKIVTTDSTLNISVTDLPDGLTWNAKRRAVEGTAPEADGVYKYTVVMQEGKGEPSTAKASLNVQKNLPMAKPMMGWISWNVVQDKISTDVVKKVSDAMVKQGLKDAGYNFLIIDDLWHAKTRHADGRPQEDPAKFPVGMKATVDYAHSKGLKFGIYSDAADRTCAGAFGSFGKEKIDAKQYAEWGVDLLKYDYCHAPGDAATAQVRYKAMGDALKASGRNILLYMCEWGAREPWKWGSTTGSPVWRATYDTRDGWNGVQGGIGIIQSIAAMKDLWPYSGVNRFNDADMMCVGIHGTGKSSNDLVAGKPGMTQDEYRTQFALWCMWSSPLLLSFDLTKPITADDKKLMTNADLIALDQDDLGQQAEYIGTTDNMVYFMKDLANGDVAISATNMSEATKEAVFDFSKFSALDPTMDYYIYDCQLQKAGETTVKAVLRTPVRKHATVVYRLGRNKITGVSSIPTKKNKKATVNFDLSGRKVEHPTAGQLVISEGNKQLTL